MDITRPIIALDLPSAEAALDFVGRFDGENLFAVSYTHLTLPTTPYV
mgnify:CR=1 FL=1